MSKEKYEGVDEFIDDFMIRDIYERYAQWLLSHYRMAAAYQSQFEPFIAPFQLFCRYKDEIFKVTGASRLGDIWLARDYKRVNGYDLRVDINECSDWSGFSDKIALPEIFNREK